MTDPIADMLTRIRNAQAVRKSEVILPASKIKLTIAQVLQEQGYLEAVEIEEEATRKPCLRLRLKYEGSRPKIMGLKRISRPGQRVYRGYEEMPRVLNGLGLAIISTPQGIMTHRQAKKAKVGGEVLCEVY